MVSNDLIIKIKSDISNFNLSQLKSELKSTQAELEKLRVSGSQNSQAWNDLKTKAGVLTGEIRSLNREYKGLDGQVKMSTQQFLEMGENITTVARGLYDVVKGLKDFGSELVNKGAELNVLKSGFKGSAQDLEALRKAAAGTVTDANLMKLSNQAGLLNINLQDQARILGFVEERFDLFGGNVEEGFNKFLNAVQGGTRGLRSLRLDTEQYNQNLKSLVQSLGGVVEEEKNDNGEKEIKIKNLPAEIQMQLRLQAALQLLNYSYADSQNKTKDLRDKTEALKVASENAKASIGEGLAKALFGLADALGLTSDKANTTIGTVTVLGSQLLGLLPIIAQLKIAFPAMATGAAASIGGLVGVIVAAGAAMAYLENLISNYIPFSFSNNVGIGFENYLDKQRKKIEDDAIKEAERMNNDPKEFNAANSKGAKLVNGEWVKLTEADVKASDQQIATLKAIEEATKKTTNTKTSGHKQNIKDIKDEKDATEELLNANKKQFEFLEATNNLNDDSLALLQMELIEARDKIDLEKASVKEKEDYVKLTKGINAYQDIFIKKQEEIYNKEQATKKLREESLKKQKEEAERYANIINDIKDKSLKLSIDIKKLQGDYFGATKDEILKELSDAGKNTSEEFTKALSDLNNQLKDSVFGDLYKSIEDKYKNSFDRINEKLKNEFPELYGYYKPDSKKFNNQEDFLKESEKDIYERDKKIFLKTKLQLIQLKYQMFEMSLEAVNKIFNGLRNMASAITQIFGEKTAQTVQKILGFFDTLIGVINFVKYTLETIKAVQETVSIFKSIFSVFGFFGGGGAGAALAEGGLFTGAGSGTSDSNLIRISNGEFVVNSQATKQWLPMLQAINGNRVSSYGAYANGGLVKSNALMQPIYIYSNMDGLTFQKITQPQYQRYKNYKRL